MKKASLSFKIAAVAGLTTVSLWITFIIIAGRIGLGVMERREMNRSLESSVLAAHMVRDAIMNHDEKTVRELPGALRQPPIGDTVMDVSVFDDAGRLMARSADFRFVARSADPAIRQMVLINSNRNQHDWTTLRDGSRAIAVVSPVRINGRRWGTVGIVVSLARVHWNFWSFLFVVLIGAAFFHVLGIYLILYNVRKVLTPLQRLKCLVDDMSEERRTEPLRISTGDEVEALSVSISRLVGVWDRLHREGEQKRLELEEHRQYVEAALENIAGGLILMDAEGRITRVNRAVEINLGMPRAQLKGRRPAEIFLKWENEDVERIIDRTLQTGESYENWRVQCELPEVSGAAPVRNIVFNVSIRPIRDHERTFGAVCVMEFLTDRVFLEDHLMRVNEELQRANRIKSEFLSTVSHELRTPLTLIKMYASMLAERKLGDITEKQEKALEVMTRRCRNLGDLINDLLDLSRIESGLHEMDIREFHPGKIISSLVGDFEQSVRAKGLSVDVEADSAVPAVYADPEQFQRVLRNLFENAVKFTDAGSIRIAVREISGDDRNPGGYVRFTVSDTGVGIPREEIGNVFQKFYQVDGSDTRKHGGSGLGLSIAREIVAMHGGRIWLESESGRGASFFFTFPKADPANSLPRDMGAIPLADEPAPPPDLEGHGRDVLLVDDDEDFLVLMRDILESGGFRVKSAPSGMIALEALFENYAPSVILLDVTMPGMTGYDLCRILKVLDNVRNVPVIMLTASGQTEQIRMGYEAGASGYLIKPFEMDNFRSTLERILGDA